MSSIQTDFSTRGIYESGRKEHGIRPFLLRVAKDVALQEQLKALAGQDAARMEEAVLKLAVDQGLPFTAEELQAFVAEQAAAAIERGDLSDGELEQVAGSKVFEDIFKIGELPGLMLTLSQHINNEIAQFFQLK